MDLLYKQDKTDSDIEQLLFKHKNLIYYMLTKMGQLTNQDAESAAWEALWDAINLFDIYSNVAFSTFACTVIRNKINDVLRKQLLINAKETVVLSVLKEDDNNLAVMLPIDNIEEVQHIYALFDEYVYTKTGMIRNILLVWHSTSFECSAKHIADICKCSVSYVCRIQQLFRAYLSSRLRQ